MSHNSFKTVEEVIADLEGQLSQSQAERAALLQGGGTGFGSISYERTAFDREEKLLEAISYLRNGGVFPFPDVMPEERIKQIDDRLGAPFIEDALYQRLWNERNYLSAGGSYPLVNVSVAKKVIAAAATHDDEPPRHPLWQRIKSLVLGA
jgi:hypothetical protein